MSVCKIYRVMATKYHPDTGGSNELMTMLNAAYEVLTQDDENE